MAKSLDYIKAAFLMPANLLALLGAGVASVATDGFVPALIALGLEGVYLGAVAASPSFQRAVRAGKGAQDRDGEKQKERLLAELHPSQREHYYALRELRDKILGNYQKLPGGGVLAASSETRVDALLTSFLRLLTSLNHYRKYLSITDRKAVEQELADVRAELKDEPSERLLAVKAKRVEILERRLSRFSQAEESRELVSHQLAGIEDLLKLTHEQSVAIRDPETVGRQLDVLAAETDATEESVREMEQFIEFDELTGPQPVHGTRVR